MKTKERKTLPSPMRKKFLNALNKYGTFVVILNKDGTKFTVYDIDTYDAKREQSAERIKNVKPWLKRQKSVLGPIGSQKLGVHSDLSRMSIYEGQSA